MSRPVLRASRLAGLALGALAIAPAVPHPAAGFASPARTAELAWPPRLSIEWPVSPFDRSAPGALFLVHAAVHGSAATVSDLAGAAEGIVAGERRTIPLRFDPTGAPGVFAVRPQWPARGTWLLRVTLAGSTTALVTLDPRGAVASVRVPTHVVGGQSLPRQVAASEIDSTLARLAVRPD